MTPRTKEKLDENCRLLCQVLALDYDSDDTRVRAIYDALSWTAEDVEKQCAAASLH
jgi:hypothetical protein